MEEAALITRQAELFLIIGTSLVVYPAAGLVNYAPWHIPKFIVDKKVPYTSSIHHLTVVEKSAGEGMKEIQQLLKRHL